MGRPLEGMLVVSVEDFSRHPHLGRITVETPRGAVRLPPAPARLRSPQPGTRCMEQQRPGSQSAGERWQSTRP